MPNWVQNNLIITGNPDSIAALLKQVKSENGDFDFEKIRPMPETLKIECSSRIDDGIEVYIKYLNFLSDSKKEPTKELEDWFAEKYEISTKIFALGKIAYENIHKYGFKTWYDWSCRYWGTKWNASEAKVTAYIAGDDTAIIRFQTAWSPPKPVICDLSKQYPDLTIRCEYADEDIGSNCGIYDYANGKITYEKEYSYGEASIKWACDVWGYDYKEYKDTF